MKNHSNKAKNSKKIPQPPELEDGYDALVEYHKKYSMEELEEAGYLEDVPPEHVRDMAASAAYQLLCVRGLHIRLSRKDYEQLSYLAAKKKVAVEKLVKKWIQHRLR